MTQMREGLIERLSQCRALANKERDNEIKELSKTESEMKQCEAISPKMEIFCVPVL